MNCYIESLGLSYSAMCGYVVNTPFIHEQSRARVSPIMKVGLWPELVKGQIQSIGSNCCRWPTGGICRTQDSRVERVLVLLLNVYPYTSPNVHKPFKPQCDLMAFCRLGQSHPIIRGFPELTNDQSPQLIA